MIGQNAQNALARALLKAPLEPVYSLIARAAPPVIDGKRLDSKTRYLLALMALAGPVPPETVTPEVARAEYVAKGTTVAPAARKLARVLDLRIDTRGGTIPARLYAPRVGGAPTPALVYFHGGGWVLGCLETHDRLCRVLAADAACTVISIDYRLAPEHKFPAAVDDAKTAYRWVIEHAATLAIDAARVAVGGDSAGGNLAAVVSLAAGREGFRPPVFQLLIYPVTDLGCDTRSYEQFADGFFLTRSLMLWFRGHYLSSIAEASHPEASPLRAEIRTPQPPALVMTAGFDPLLDEGEAFARKLRDVGTNVVYRCHEGLIHGFASMTGVIPRARAAMEEAAAALRLSFSRL